MNTEPLTRLADRAEDVTGRADDRLTEVHTRIRTHRRRRTAGVVVGAGVLVLAVVAGTYGVRAGLTDPAVEPAGPTPGVRNGAVLSFTSVGDDVAVVRGDLAHVPDDAYPFTSLQFSSDGREIVYVARGRRVTTLDVSTGSRRVLATCSEVCQPSLSPDGRTLALDDGGELALQAVAGGAAPRLGISGWAPTWSPDGRRLAYLDRRGLMVVDRDGSDARRLATYDVGVLRQPTWSPDGRRLVFVLAEEVGPGVGNLPEFRHSLATVGLDGAPPVRLADLGTCVCLGVAAPTATWSPDGTLLAYTRVDPGPPRNPDLVTSGGVFTSRPDGTGEELLTSGFEAGLAWQPLPDR